MAQLSHQLSFDPNTPQIIMTAAEMRACEARAFASGTISGRTLMERAGRGVVDAITRQWPHFAQTPGAALILCGPGNNGGDGYAIARLLAGRGWNVTVSALGADGLTGDAGVNKDRWSTLGQIQDVDAGPPDLHHVAGFDLVVDALFGTGLSRPLTPYQSKYLDLIGAEAQRIIAVDVPSGLHTDSGKLIATAPMPNWPRADLIVTFQRPKPVHMLNEICRQSALYQVDLGLDIFEQSTIRAPTLSPDLLKRGTGHKYDHGHCCVLAGGYGDQRVGIGGAARLAAHGALRIGCGAVTVLCPPAALLEHAQQLNAVMTKPIRSGKDLVHFVNDRSIAALCVGPALGVSAEASAMLGAVLSMGLPAVLDADALTNLACNSAGMIGQLHNRIVLTPHAAEFARLFPDIAKRWTSDALSNSTFSKLNAAQEAAERSGTTLLLKGAVTVIATPGGKLALSIALRDNSAPWLATAGAGDVLAGIITGLLARGFSPFDAAHQGALLHVAAARTFGPGLTAEDLPAALANVLGELDKQQRAGVESR